MKNYIIFPFILIFLTAFLSCSKTVDNEAGSDNNGDNNEVFTEHVKLSYIKDGISQELSFTGSDLLDAYTFVDELDGYDLKRLEVEVEDEIEIYPSLSFEFPMVAGEVSFGTTYGSDNDYPDFIKLQFSEYQVYFENTEYADLVGDDWEQPWLNVTEINELDNGQKELTAEFGGTLIHYNEEDEDVSTVQIDQGIIQISVYDDYPGFTDNSYNISNPPSVGSGSGGSGQNNIIADFEFRVPGTYVMGTQMLFDTATIRIENKSSNADYFEWELLTGSTNYNDSYFQKETQIASPPFNTLVYLDNASDSSRYRVKMTAYDNNGNSKTVIKSVSLPMMKGEIYLNGDLIERGNIYYVVNGEGYLNRLASNWSGWIPSNEKRFWFATEGVFPSDGTFLTDFHQRESIPYTESDDEFFVKIGNKWTYDDPNGEASSMTLDNLSVRVQRANINKIIGLISANYTLRENGEGAAESGNIEIRYLAPSGFYN